MGNGEGMPMAAGGGRNPYTGKRFRKALRYFVVGRAAQAVATLAVTLVAIRVMSPTDYGAYLVLLGIVEVCRSLGSLGLLPTIQQYLPELALHGTRERLRLFVRYTTLARFGLLIVFAGLVVLSWDSLSDWLGLNASARSFGWIIAVLIVTLLGATFADHILEALLEQRFAQTIRAIYPFGRLCGLLFLSQGPLGATLENVLWLDILISLLCLLLAEIVLVIKMRDLHSDGTRVVEWREMYAFGWHLSGSQLISAIGSGGILRAIVSNLQGVAVAGQFGFLQQILHQLARFMPSVLLANLIRPMLIAARVRGDDKLVVGAGDLLWKTNLVILFPFVAAIAVCGNEIATALSGARLQDAGLALLFTAIATSSIAQTNITNVLLQVYKLSADVRRASLLSITGPLLVWIGGGISLTSACAGVAVSLWLRSAFGVFLLRRSVSATNYDWRGVLRALLAAALAGAVGIAVARISWVASIPIVMLSYPCWLLVLKPLVAADAELIRRALGRDLAILGYLVRVDR